MHHINEALIHAVQTGKIDAVRVSLQRKGNPNYIKGDGYFFRKKRIKMKENLKIWLLLSLTFVGMAVCQMTTHAGENPKTPQPMPEIRVESSFGHEDSTISSFIVNEKGVRVLHGLQVHLGPKSQMRMYESYNNGALGQKMVMHSNSRIFLQDIKGRNEGDRDVTIFSADFKAVSSGTKRNGQMWDGTFIVNDDMFTVPHVKYEEIRLKFSTYKNGVLVDKKPFNMDDLKLAKDSWLRTEISFALTRGF